MIRIGQLKIKTGHTKEELHKKVQKVLDVKKEEIADIRIRKQSLDARKKPELFYVYTIDILLKHPEKEKIILKKNRRHGQITEAKTVTYHFPDGKVENAKNHRPLIVGSGPAGLFCAFLLAKHGYKPILIERGAKVEERKKEVEAFWQTGVLNPESNVQFGEGGAGTFSDGKLNTLVKDPDGRNQEVLKIFVENGAPEEILYMNKPHIGTDLLIQVVRNIRESIEKAGGQCLFHTKLIRLDLQDGAVKGVWVQSGEKETYIASEKVVLALGHSARDTFQTLYEQSVPMEAKAFAVGVRIEHEQRMINRSQYGVEEHPHLPAAAYKLTAKSSKGRGVYTFCMCPGGYVVNASSEKGRLCVNGMSYHGRAGRNANSAVIVTVSPEDYCENEKMEPLSGIRFQRMLEERAYEEGKGKIPVQRFGDFCKNQMTKSLGHVEPQMKGGYQFGNVRSIFPEEIASAIEEGIFEFDKKIKGYADPDTILSGVEARTSSPLRLKRDDTLQSIGVRGLYPCGEGAGYAGGITSAAMDGMKVAEKIAESYCSHGNI